MRSAVVFFCTGIFLANVDCSPARALPSRSPLPKLPSDPSAVTSSEFQTVELRTQDIRDGLSKVYPKTKNFSPKTIGDIFLACLDKNDFSTDDATIAASKPTCMALGIFPANSLKFEPIIDEIIRLVSLRLNPQSAGPTPTNAILKEFAHLEQQIVDTWSALLNDGYILAIAKSEAQTSPTHKTVQGSEEEVTVLRKRTDGLVKRAFNERDSILEYFTRWY
jgi:hypothetical protein